MRDATEISGPKHFFRIVDFAGTCIGVLELPEGACSLSIPVYEPLAPIAHMEFLTAPTPKTRTFHLVPGAGHELRESEPDPQERCVSIEPDRARYWVVLNDVTQFFCPACAARRCEPPPF